MRSKWMVWSLIGVLALGTGSVVQAGGGQVRNQGRNRAAQEGAGGAARGNQNRQRLRDGTGPGCQDGCGVGQPRQGLQRQRQRLRDGSGPGCTAVEVEE